jgi:hypothetical protein
MSRKKPPPRRAIWEEPLSAVSIPAPAGISKSGASLFATDVLTASAKLLWGRSQEPCQAAMAQWIGSPLDRDEVLHNSASCAIWRAAAAMLEHGANIAAVTDLGVPGSPARPTAGVGAGRVGEHHTLTDPGGEHLRLVVSQGFYGLARNHRAGASRFNANRATSRGRKMRASGSSRRIESRLRTADALELDRWAETPIIFENTRWKAPRPQHNPDLYLYSPRGNPFTETSLRARWYRWLGSNVGLALCSKWRKWINYGTNREV